MTSPQGPADRLAETRHGQEQPMSLGSGMSSPAGGAAHG